MLAIAAEKRLRLPCLSHQQRAPVASSERAWFCGNRLLALGHAAYKFIFRKS